MAHELNNPLVEKNAKKCNESPNRSKHSEKKEVSVTFHDLHHSSLSFVRRQEPQQKTAIVERFSGVSMSFETCGRKVRLPLDVQGDISCGGCSIWGAYQEMVSNELD